MIKLTHADEGPTHGLAWFVNPHHIRMVSPRLVSAGDETDAGKVEGSWVQIGEDQINIIAVFEDAEDIASFVSNAIDMYGITDIAAEVAARKEREREEQERRDKAGCKRNLACECEVCTEVPF